MTTWFFAGMTTSLWLPLLMAFLADVHRHGLKEVLIEISMRARGISEEDDENEDEDEDQTFLEKMYCWLAEQFVIASPICWIISAIIN
jgi:hypothetical protein